MKRSEIKRRLLADTTLAGLEPEHATYRELDGKPPQNSAQMPDYLKARKLHLNGIIVVLTGMKKLNAIKQSRKHNNLLSISLGRTIHPI